MKIRKEYIPLFKGVDLSTRRLPFLVAETDAEGPTVCLTAAIHGDEVTGTAVISQIFNMLESTPLAKGKLYGFPILNPTGFEAMTRRDLFAEEDLNRNFPGRPDGDTAERHAWTIFSTIANLKSDYVIDLHTDSLNSIIYTIVDYPAEAKHLATFRQTALLAQRLELPWVVDTEKSAGYPVDSCLSGCLITHGIPAVTIELGAPYIVMNEEKEQGIAAIWRFLTWLGMLPGQKPLLPDKLPTKVLTIYPRVYTQSSGIIEYRIQAGDRIAPNKIIGKIRNVFGETIEVIRSPVEGILLSHEDQSITFPGKELFTIAIQAEAKNFFL